MVDNFSLSINPNSVGGKNDPANGKGVTPSSSDAAKGTAAPDPFSTPPANIPLIGSPIIGTPIVTDILHIGPWTLYSKDGNLLASNGTSVLQVAMFNPSGIVQTDPPNKLSDGSDGSSGASSGNTDTSGRTVSTANMAGGTTGAQTSSGSQTSSVTEMASSIAGGSSGSSSGATNPTPGSKSSTVSSNASQTVGSVPCLPPDVAGMLSKLTPGGLTGLVLDLSKQTEELTKLTKLISTLLPGVPFSVTGTIIKEFTDGFKTLTGGLSEITGELTTGISSITNQLGCITRDLTAISAAINGVIGSMSNASFISALPSNLSVDSLIGQLSSVNSTLVSGVSSINSLQNSLNLAQTNAPPPAPSVGTPTGPAETVAQSNTSQGETGPTGVVTTELVAVSDPQFITENVEPNSKEGTEFIATIQLGLPGVTEFLGRSLTEVEWNNLIAATYVLAGHDYEATAWVIGTILNRCRQSGLSVMDVLKDSDQFGELTNGSTSFSNGPPLDIEYNINNAANNSLKAVSTANFYFTHHNNTVSSVYKNGIQGIAIGSILVFPNAKWN